MPPTRWNSTPDSGKDDDDGIFGGRAHEVFHQKSGDVTKAYYADLAACGPAGELGVALFRAQKRSTAAKQGRRYRGENYDVKEYSLKEVSRIIEKYSGKLTYSHHGGLISIDHWGWKQDPDVRFGDSASWVLYVDLPWFGQVSFHNPSRLHHKNYEFNWDGARGVSEERIISYCNAIMSKGPANSEGKS